MQGVTIKESEGRMKGRGGEVRGKQKTGQTDNYAHSQILRALGQAFF